MGAFTAVIPSIMSNNWRRSSDSLADSVALQHVPRNLYAVSFAASRPDGSVSFSTAIMLRASFDEAEREGFKIAKERFPEADGYEKHDVNILVVDDEFVQDIVEAYKDRPRYKASKKPAQRVLN